MSAPFYERLTTQDLPFLLFETPNCHMHLGGTAIFEAGPLTTAEGGIDIARIRRRIASRLHMIPRYRQRLAWVPIEGHPVWVDDEHFNLAYHVRHTALPRPGNETQLKRLAARVMGQQLDRDRPLWEVWVVEGLEDNRFALVMKTHHCIADGISGVDLLTVLLGLAPEDDIDDATEWYPRPAPAPRELLANEWRRRLRLPFELPALFRSALRAPAQVRETVAEGAAAVWKFVGTTGLRLPSETPLNRPIGPHRRLDWFSVDLDDVKLVKNRLGGTVNDVVLAIVAGGLRRFLRHRHVNVDGLTYRVVCPVSVRSADERGTVNNRASAWLLDLPLDIDDARERLARVAATTVELKEARVELGPSVLGQVAEMAGGAFLTLGIRLVRQISPYNLIVTNIPGPPVPLYLLGARLVGGYPLVPLFENQGLGIALFSYDGRLFWGLSADWDVVPDLPALTSALQHAFAELRAAAETAPVARLGGRAAG
jgi:WS/DGAT/MGAT family acyltransferase